jgi:glycosyltransferase involved in cell wall biosynthesis
MPTYNDEEYIGKAINSLLNQSYKDWELIVIDGSSDSTPEIVRQFADRDKRIRYLREQSSGQLNALMQGAQFVRGEFVTLLHSDDELTDDKAIERNVSILMKNSCDGIFCDLIIMNDKGEYAGVVKTPESIDFSSLATLFLRGASNIIPDFFFTKKETFGNVLSSYVTWGVQYWLKFEETGVATLNLKKVFPWYKYRLYSENYGRSDVGKFELATGGLRTILEIGKVMDLPFLKLQRFLARVFKTRMKPLFKRRPISAKHLREMVRYVITNRYESVPRNLYYNGVLGFYSNFPSNRTIKLNLSKEDTVFLGKDTYLFFKLMEKKSLPAIYEFILEEAVHGFGRVIVNDKEDYQKARNMLKFLNLLANIDIK